MAEIVPFRGIRYNSERFGDLTGLLAPPYDVIRPHHQDELYARHENNVVRIDFGKAEPDDAETSNRYTRAAGYLKRWLADGVLIKEGVPCLYLYKVEYKDLSGSARELTGFVCMLRLEEWDKGVVLPHEGTLKGPKKDRLELMKATGASASQIFSLYSDPHKTISKAMDQAVKGRAPDAQATDDDGALHRMWVVSDLAAIETARGAMEDKLVFIADGHHRYETALAFRDTCRAGGCKGREYFNYVPMFLSNMDEAGLTVLPTHRLVKYPDSKTLAAILGEAGRYFEIDEVPFTPKDEAEKRREFLGLVHEKGKDAHAFGLFHRGAGSYYVLTLKDPDAVKEAAGEDHSEAYLNLDVTILHSLVIERVLGMDTSAVSESMAVQFEKDDDKAISRVAEGEFDLCFIMNPTKVREVREVALAREIMPQKSTYFYPKLMSGMVIADLMD